MGNTTARDNREEDQEAILNTPQQSKTNWKCRCSVVMILFIVKLYFVSQRSSNYSNVPSLTIDQSYLKESSVEHQKLYENAYQGFIARNKEMLSDYEDNQKLQDDSEVGSIGSTTENLLIKRLASLNDRHDNN